MTARVLICDAQPHISRAIALHLLRADFDVWTVSSGEQALARMAQFRPDVLIVDVDLPANQGWDVVASARLHSEYSDLHVIALTDQIPAIVAQEARQRDLPIDEILTVPFSPRQLRAKICQWEKAQVKLLAQ